MAWIAAAVGVGSSIFGSLGAKSAAKKAAKATEAGVKRVENNTGFKQYSQGGQRSFNASQNLLGLNNTPAQIGADGQPIPGTSGAEQSRAGFQNYLESAGYKTQLNSGIDALNSNAAARGMLKSGATLKATQRFGAGLGQQYFNNYIGQLNGQTGFGQQADQTLANVYTGGAAGQANANMAAGAATSGAFADAGQNIAGAIGYYNKPPAPTTTPVTPATTTAPTTPPPRG